MALSRRGQKEDLIVAIGPAPVVFATFAKFNTFINFIKFAATHWTVVL
jgi:hypothetical protein